MKYDDCWWTMMDNGDWLVTKRKFYTLGGGGDDGWTCMGEGERSALRTGRGSDDREDGKWCETLLNFLYIRKPLMVRSWSKSWKLFKIGLEKHFEASDEVPGVT